MSQPKPPVVPVMVTTSLPLPRGRSSEGRCGKLEEYCSASWTRFSAVTVVAFEASVSWTARRTASAKVLTDGAWKTRLVGSLFVVPGNCSRTTRRMVLRIQVACRLSLLVNDDTAPDTWMATYLSQPLRNKSESSGTARCITFSTTVFTNLRISLRLHVVGERMSLCALRSTSA